MNDSLITEIDALKEVLSVMPRNNIKNLKEVEKKIESIAAEYSIMQQDAKKELDKRYNQINSVSTNIKLDEIKEILNYYEEKLPLLNKINSPYEKLGLDKLLYNLSKFYKENFDKVNEYIDLIIKKFTLVGVNLTKDDFYYSSHTKEYMEVFLASYTSDREKLKDKFDSIYWKCPEIINHICLNFKSLYFKNEKRFIGYVNELKNTFLKQAAKKEEDIIKYYQDLRIEYDDIQRKDLRRIFDLFLNKELSIKDFTLDKNNKNLESFTTSKNSEIYEYILKLSYSLEEFKNYSNLEYIYLDVKELYKNKEKSKDLLKKKFKEISKKEQELGKLNKKVNKSLNKKPLFFKRKQAETKIDKINVGLNNKINELKDLYDTLDNDIFISKISEYLTDNSSIYDCFYLAFSYYDYLVEVIKKNNIEKEEDMKEEIKKLDVLLKYPYNTIINNISIIEEKNLKMIISDKYKLMNINIEQDDLDVSNIDNLITIVSNILLFKEIEDSKTTTEEISFLCNYKDTVK